MVISNIIVKGKGYPMWAILFYGIARGWIDSSTFFSYLDESEMNDLAGEVVDEYLRMSELNNTEFEIYLNKIYSYNNMQNIKNVWKIIILNNIILKNIDKETTLHEVANVWPIFDYDKDWKNFIYYMPSENGSNIDSMYINLLEYIKLRC